MGVSKGFACKNYFFIVCREPKGSLGLELYSSAEDDVIDVNINKALLESGVLTKQTFKKVNHTNTCITMRPG